MLSIAAKYRDYCSNIARTLFIEPSDDQKDIYCRCYELHNLIISNLKPGNTIKSVYEKGIEFIKDKLDTII